MSKTIKCAAIGYGAAFNMGKAHSNWINNVNGMKAVAVCDVDPKRTAAAAEDFPGIETYNDLSDMLKKSEFDLAVVVTPHNTHAKLAIQCLEAGKHVVVEKPMCITAKEATDMIEAAKKSKVMLSVFHNRRHDGDYMTLKEIVAKGLIGDIFHVEMFGGGYGRPGKWWRSDKKISGGAFYDWGAHYLDWLLNLVPGKVVGVTGFFHKLVWKEVTNEDHVEAMIRFESGAVADVQFSSLAMAKKPRWQILGTKGSVVSQAREDSFKVTTVLKGYPAQIDVPYKKSDWESYYQNIADHILRGKELEVKPEEARRVIAIMEAAEKSSKERKTVEVPHE